MRLKIITWNINSVRLRLENLGRIIAQHNPDIIALQETKCADEHFPLEALREMGYPHIEFHGQKAYHGVAILSRLPLINRANHDFNSTGHTRHQMVEIRPTNRKAKHPLILHNFYIPAGGDIPDRQKNEKFGQKLDYLTNLTAWFNDAGGDHSERMILVGDLNIAPLPSDVWSHKQLLKVVSHTPIEVEHLKTLQATRDWQDVMRNIKGEEEPVFSWWSYRAKDWRGSNRGRRLDHIWLTPKLSRTARSIEVLTETRDWEKASDHAPVILELEL